MGFHDRDYNRNDRDGFASLSGWSVNTWLIVINIAVFIMMALSPVFRNAAYDYGHFSTFHVLYHNVNGNAGGLEFWRFLTFQFLHAPGLMHVGMNMLGLYIFGGIVESQLGSRKYLAFYLVCGIFGGLMYLLLNLAGHFFPQVPLVLINDVRTPLVGASAGVFGVILACARIAPDMQVQLLFPPIPMRMRTMAYVYVGIAIVTLLMRGSNAGGEAAHLGGAAAGFFFIRNSHLLRDFFDVIKDSRKSPPRAGPKRRPASPAQDPSHDEEVDRILAKVKEKGVQSLSDREKRVLARDTEEKRARG